MRFLADMGVSHRVTAWLQDGGHDVVHLRDEGLHKLPDGEIFLKADREKRILLTFDLDFGEIVALSRGDPVSVVLFRVNDTSPAFVIRRLEEVLGVIEDVLRWGAMVVVEDARHRIRRLPPGS